VVLAILYNIQGTLEITVMMMMMTTIKVKEDNYPINWTEHLSIRSACHHASNGNNGAMWDDWYLRFGLEWDALVPS